MHLPDGGEDLQHIGARDFRDGYLPDVREGVEFQAARPVPRVSRTAPAGPLSLEHGRGDFGEAMHAQGAAFLGQRIPVFAGKLAGASAFSRASAIETKATLPSPSSCLRPRTTSC